MKATAKDLRFYSKELLEAVSRGEEVLITYRGMPHPKLVPLPENENADNDEIELFGIWRVYTEMVSVDEYVRNLSKARI